MLQKSLKVAIALSFIMLMGQQSCQTTPSGQGNRRSTAPGQTDATAAAAPSSRSNVPGDRGPNSSVTCGSPQNTFQCMMCNCHLEAGNQSYEGKVAVNRVVMTRARMSSYPNSVCGVIYQRAQFSWTLQRSTRNKTISGSAYNNCYNSVREAYNSTGHFASHYHANYVSPGWRRGCSGRFTIGAHHFYRTCGGQRPAPASGSGSDSVAQLFLRGEDLNVQKCSL